MLKREGSFHILEFKVGHLKSGAVRKSVEQFISGRSVQAMLSTSSGLTGMKFKLKIHTDNDYELGLIRDFLHKNDISY